MTNKIFYSFGIYFIGNILVGTINFIMVPIYSHFLSPADYGILNLLLYMIVVATVIVDIGQSTAFSVIFYKVEQDKRTVLIYSALFLSALAFCIISVPFVIFRGLVAGIIRAQISYNIQIKLICIVALTVFTNFFVNLLRLLLKPALYIIASLIRSVILGILNILFLAIMHQTFDSYLNAVAISLLALSLWAAIYIIKEFRPVKARFDSTLLLRLLKVGIPLLPYGILGFLGVAGDKLILNALLSAAAVGSYSFGYRLGSIIDPFLTTPLGQAISPALYRTFASDRARYCRMLKDAWFAYLTVGMTMLLAVATFGDAFFKLAIASSYWKSFPVVILVLGGFLLNGAGTMLGATIVVHEKTHWSPVMITISTVVCLGLDFLFIPRYGILGAAAAFVVGSLVSLTMYICVTQSLQRLKHRWVDIAKSTTPLGIAVFVNYLLSNIERMDFRLILGKAAIALCGVGVVFALNGKNLLALMRRE